jgi:energy-converting hydrogenase Eha subunit A
VHVLIGLVGINVCFLVWGYRLLALLRWQPGIRDCGLAYCAGVGALSTAASVLAVLGHVPGLALTVAVTAVLALPSVFAARRRRPSWRWSPPTGESVAAGLVGLAVATYAVTLLRAAYVRPLQEWDAWAIWTVKAKGLVTLGGLGSADFVGAWPA